MSKSKYLYRKVKCNTADLPPDTLVSYKGCAFIKAKNIKHRGMFRVRSKIVKHDEVPTYGVVTVLSADQNVSRDVYVFCEATEEGGHPAFRPQGMIHLAYYDNDTIHWWPL